MTAQAASDANARTRAKKLSRLGVAVRVGNTEMDSISAQPLSKLGVVRNENGDLTGLYKIDQSASPAFIGRCLAAAKQDTGRIGARERLGEVSFELCRRL